MVNDALKSDSDASEVYQKQKISEVNKMENFELKREEIERLWSQIVSQMGITRFSHTEWQKAYEDFRKCMLPESKCLIQIQSVNNAEEIKTLYLLMIYIFIYVAGEIDRTLWPEIVGAASEEATVEDCGKESVQAE